MREIRLLIIVIFVLGFAAGAQAGSTAGRVYYDANGSARSHLRHEPDPEDVGLSQVAVTLHGAGGNRRTETGRNGWYVFSGLQEGTYFTEVELPPEINASSHNMPRRLPDAIREGEVTILAIGDSLGVVGSAKTYPQWLGEQFATLTDVTVNNLHVGGSRSWEWMPGDPKAYWEDRVLPYIEETDLVVLSVGGNDADIYVEGMYYGEWDFVEMLRRFLADPEYLLLVIPRVRELIENIHAANPDADIMYFLYPNYANSCFTAPLLGGLQNLALAIIETYIERQRDVYQELDYLIFADMYQYWYETALDDVLVDEIHYNDLGHEIIGGVMFEILGGVRIDPGHPVDSRRYGTDALYCVGCLIGDDCHVEGTINPDNPCAVCDPSRDGSGWSDNEGASCDDGLFCNGADLCDSGRCSAHAGNPCDAATQACNEEVDACEPLDEDDDGGDDDPDDGVPEDDDDGPDDDPSTVSGEAEENDGQGACCG